MVENVADGTDGRYKRDLWTLDTALRGLLFMCRVELRWNLVSTSSLSSKEAEKGVAWLSLVHCEMLDYACTAHFFIMEIDFSKKKGLPCWILLTSLDQKPVCMALGYFFSLIKGSSLVPRLPRSGTQTMKLCRCGEPGIFSHVSSLKGRKNLIVRGHMRLRKRAKVAGTLLHVSSYRASNIIHTKC